MKPANTKARALRAKLAALVERGVAGEADSAKRKLARLEKSFDFTAENPDDAATRDLFRDALGSYGMHRDCAEKFADYDIASFVKWAILNAYGIEGKLRENRDHTISLVLEASHESMKVINHVARLLNRAFSDLLAAFLALPGAGERDGRTFVRACYDGCMNDQRKDCEPLPSRATVKMPKGKKRSVVVAPGIAIHPYTVGVELGRKIRISVPIEQIAGDLKNREEAARLAA